MAHGGAAPNPHIQHRTPPPLPGVPRRQLDQGLKLIVRAFACRESEVLQLRRQAADKDRKIAHLELALNQAKTCFRGALEQNAMLLKKWDVRCVMLKQWGLSNLKDIGVGRVEEFNKLLAEVAGLKESLIADGNNEEDGGVAKVEEFNKIKAEAVGLEEAEAPCIQDDEIRSALSQQAPLTTQDIVRIFKPRLSTQKRKADFAERLRKISKIQKRDGQNWIVLRELL